MKNLSFNIRYLLTIFIFFLFLYANQAQSLLFTVLDTSGLQFSQGQVSIYEKLMDETQYSVLQVVQFNSLGDIQQNGSLRVYIPENICDTAVFKATNVEYNDSDNFIWYGYMVPNDSSDCLDGNLLLGSDSGQIFGSMRVGNKLYTFEDLGDGLRVLAEAPGHEVVGCGATDLGEPEAPPAIVERTNDCDIRVLTLYTDAVANNVANPMTLALNALAKTNQILKNSGLGSSYIHFVNAGIEQFSGLSESGQKFTDIWVSLSASTGVQARRSATNADIVVLLVHPPIMQQTSVAGLAIQGLAGANGAFAVVRARGSDNGIVYAHEIAHILGARHERCSAEDAGQGTGECDDDPSPGHAHTWSYTSGGKTIKRKTVMFYAAAGNPEIINYYSNYQVKFEGRPTGIQNVASNALVLLTNACTVANYWSADQSLSAHIEGPAYGCVDNAEAFAAVTGGARPIFISMVR